MRVLDVFCCQGGASAGYARAGHTVTGVDLAPQPRYPFEFFQSDAIQYVLDHGHKFDFIHASPPCQAHSKTQRIQGNAHPELIAATREVLDASGRPYVIENVEDAASQLLDPIMLCGTMFGLRTYRHRLFEASGFVLPQPPHPSHDVRTVKMGRPLRVGDFYHAVGNFSNVEYVRQDMDVPWMSRDGIRECIPPAFAEWVISHVHG